MFVCCRRRCDDVAASRRVETGGGAEESLSVARARHQPSSGEQQQQRTAPELGQPAATTTTLHRRIRTSADLYLLTLTQQPGAVPRFLKVGDKRDSRAGHEGTSKQILLSVLNSYTEICCLVVTRLFMVGHFRGKFTGEKVNRRQPRLVHWVFTKIRVRPGPH